MQDSSSNNAKFSVVIPECFDRERREVKRVNKLTPRLPRPPDYELHAKTDPKSAEKQPKNSRKSAENRKKIERKSHLRAGSVHGILTLVQQPRKNVAVL